jgi:RimJ/RimL family protein N-acetyltransferase
MNIRLEQLKRTDFPVINDWIDPEIFHIFTAPIDESQLEKLLTKEQNGIITEIGLRAVENKTDQIIGLVHAVVDRDNDLIHLQQIVVDPEKCNRGYGAAILELFLELCFTEYNSHRVQLFTEENNKQAIACYIKVGFHIDGMIRDRIKTATGFIGTYIFSMLDNEWFERYAGKKNIK